tara:strand:+ start:5526 stop:7382 length:1857 start_codon:yes stop_codon:yes gene_type:complete
MSIKRYTASKDNTIANAFKANLTGRGTTGNMGASDILEIFSIFGQASSSSIEQARMLVEVPVSEISTNRAAGEIPESGSVTFKYKMFNAGHGQTTPEQYSIVASPIIKSWSEGSGLDMEEYSDLESSNWTSASLNSPWTTAGGDYTLSSSIGTHSVPLDYVQYFETGFEDLELDITGLVEEWIKGNDLTATAATGSIVFHEKPAQGSQFLVYAHDGDYRTFQVSTTTGSVGKTILFETGSTTVNTTTNFVNAVNTHLGTSIAATATSGSGPEVTASLAQSMTGFYGNTIISASAHITPALTASVLGFGGGTGAQPYGLLLRLSGSAESGTAKQSYYTKKFFARSSHHFLKRPVIEAQWAPTILDDRSRILKSSSLSPAAENLNNIYLYNRRRNGLVDIPDTGSFLVVQLYPSASSLSPVGLAPGGGVAAHSPFYVTASRSEKGIYKAQFAYSGSEASLVDVWSKQNANFTHNQLYTGSSFVIKDETSYSHYETPTYVTNITNLKSTYTSDEVATFRIYTRDKSISPNVYTVASNTAPITIIQDGFYKLRRVSDNENIITYSTSSTPSYSSLSYDASGSFFDLDMSILEPNYLYEISLLYRDGTDYVEQKEKFKFRVDP